MTLPCGCCVAAERRTPVVSYNRPGLRALAYRAGTHATFLETMIARLSSLRLDDDDRLGARDPLANLTARSLDDPSIGFLDAWAIVCDVLTFYQERIANEGYLRTAIERRSILELARLVGYRLRPAIGASTFLAYTLDRDPNGDTVADIPRDSRAQSVPGPGELPQTFETIEDLRARYSWNDLTPRLTQPQVLGRREAERITTLYLEGITTNLRPNDVLLIDVGDGGDPVILDVLAVVPDPEANRTAVTIQRPVHTLLGILKALETELPAYRDLKAAGVTAGAIATRIVDDILMPLNDWVTDALGNAPARIVTAADLRRALASALASLTDELASARAHRYDVIAGWLAGIVEGLSTSASQAATLPDTATIGNGPVTAITAPKAGRPITSLEVLGAVLAPLSAPSVVRPSHARDLVRDPRSALGPTADFAARLRTTLDPALKGTLYTALANARPPSVVARTEVLRVKAAPFGATAPKQPIVDERGAVIGTTEWPLATAMLQVRARQTQTDGNGDGGSLFLHLAFTVDVAGTRHTFDELALEGSSPPTTLTGPGEIGSITVTILDALMVKVVATLGAPSTSKHTLTLDVDQEGLSLAVDAHQWHKIRPDDPVRFATERERLSAEFVASQHGTEGAASGTGFIVYETAVAPPANILALDATYDQIVPGSHLVVRRGTVRTVHRVVTVDSPTVAAYGTSAKVTRLELEPPWLSKDDTSLGDVRGVTVYAQGEILALAPEPVGDEVKGREIPLERLIPALDAGRWIIVSGERTDIPNTPGVRASELAMLAQVIHESTRAGDPIRTTLHLEAPLAYRYARRTVKIWGNVVKATHGESRAEVLGSGDAAAPFQSFTLLQPPLTYLASPGPLGAESTLTVRVDDVAWDETDTLVTLGPIEHAFVTRTDDDDRTTIVFGDGITGARLPTGANNVQARYRSGAGRGGNVAAGQLSQLKSRPLGVGEVTNPLPATGGADREEVSQARRNAPLGVTALDRLVSVQDYEDFARGRAGIGKASARRVSDGARATIHVTIAGTDDVPIDEHSDLHRALRTALARHGDPALPVLVARRELVLLLVVAKVRVAPAYRWDLVEPRLRAALYDAFGFEQRELGAHVAASEVLSVMQAVPGVAYVDLDTFTGIPESTSPTDVAALATRLASQRRVTARLARHEVRDDPFGPEDTLATFAARNAITVERLFELNPGLAMPVPAGRRLVVARGFGAAELVVLSPALPDTLMLRELPS